jgi:hypothetical protein
MHIFLNICMGCAHYIFIQNYDIIQNVYVQDQHFRINFKFSLPLCYYKLIDFYKNTNHQQMHKESFIINRNTLLHVLTLLGRLQGELFCYRYTTIPACTAVQCRPGL